MKQHDGNQFITPPYPWQTTQWQQLLTCHQKNLLPHALLFHGLKDVGKLFFANKFSQILLCEKNSICNQCSSCNLLRANNHPDLLLIQPEIEKKTIKIEQIRYLIERLQQTPQQGHCQVAIIEPAEAMNLAAANALLKTLEEPYGNVYLILISHQPTLIPITIRSRCQTLKFTVTSQQELIFSWLQQQLPQNTDIAKLLRFANNMPLKALQLAQENQLLNHEKLIENLLALVTGNIEPLKLAAEYKNDSPQNILTAIIYLLLDTLKLKFIISEKHIYHQDSIRKIQKISQKISKEKLINKLEKILNFQQMLTKNANLNVQLLLEDIFITIS